MVGAYDSSIHAKFYGNPRHAAAAATEEAAMTGGIVQAVSSIRVEGDNVWFYGGVPARLFLSRLPEGCRSYENYYEVSATGFGSFHTDWSSVVTSPPLLGRLVFFGCESILRTSPRHGCDVDSEELVIGIRTYRAGYSFNTSHTIGAYLCRSCGITIDARRRQAIPGVTLCTNCQNRIEEVN